jgi:hypothetical protein
VSYKSSLSLADKMVSADRDFSLDEIYRVVCRPPHQEMLTPDQLHRRVSRYIGEARRILKTQGHLIVFGEMRHSYRAVKRKFTL